MSIPNHGRAALEERLRNLQEDHGLRTGQLGRAQEESERIRIARDRTALEREIAAVRQELQEATTAPSASGVPHPTSSRTPLLLVGSVLSIVVVALAAILMQRSAAPETPAPRPPSGTAVSPQVAPATPQPPLPGPAMFPVVVGWTGGGENWASFGVRVRNTTGQDVYVKSLELRGVQGGNCALVPRFPELVPRHPFVRANDSRSVIPELRFKGTTQRDLTLCEIKAIAVLVMSPTYPAPESLQNFVVSESQALGN